ncbi:polysaccharide export outer membrane protein [Tistlia consotensis]|uniref:Polysaccharide export outer membrane protein n=1 Tax=Tistlia consotensis USBA 355 TaxID=560819 RepID=A0A1Y6CJN6_9PROT|nr:polysaccharide biosynthesis/export family protein [Tistlia consotensis]SMF59129.1 polysaccharide export outer membrane protein [Tistlia consotensis USBA 355]SNR64161.1 polysaccharide export outer membrane protein [Tistlia consotensis]
MFLRLDLPTPPIATVAGLFLLAAGLGGCAGDPGAPDLAPKQTEYRLGPGDKVLVTVFGQDDLTGQHVVDGQGDISLSLIGAVPAGDKTAPQLADAIARRLSPKYLNDPKVSVQVLNYRPFYIVGEVKSPGSYPYVDDMTVMNAVALAGGLTYRAREDEFYITRKADPEKVKREAFPNTEVEPGDLITVRERFF